MTILDLSSILNNSLPLTVCDEDGVLVLANDCLCNLLGTTQAELVGKPHILFTSPESALSIQKIKENVKKHNTFDCEYQFTLPSGECRWLDVKFKPRLNEKKETIGYVSFYTNITDKKIQQARLSQLLASNEIGTWEFLLEEERFLADEHCFNLLGYGDNQDHSLKAWLDKVNPDDVPALKESFYKHLKKENEFFNAVYRVGINGEERYIHTKGKLIEINALGTPKRMVGLVHDVTSFKLMENQIEEQKDFYQSLLDNLPVPLFVKDATDFTFTFWNKKAEESWGKLRQDVIGKNDYDFFPKIEADFFRKKDQEVMAAITPIDIAEEAITTPIGVRLFQTRKVPLIQNGKRFLLGISQDITDRVEAQKKLLISSKMAAIGQMAGSIAHEINTPLSVITMLSGQFKRSLNRENCTTETGIEFANKIEKTAFRISRIIRGLKHVSRDGSNDPMQIVTMGSIIEDTLEVCQMGLERAGIPLEVLPYNKEDSVSCRSTEISQILLNLINNSKDAVMDLPEKWIKIKIKTTKASIIISVIDSGSGIPQQYQSKLMSPFFTTKAVGNGTGLGLSISRQIATAHGGNLELDNKNPNTCFKLTLPLHK